MDGSVTPDRSAAPPAPDAFAACGLFEQHDRLLQMECALPRLALVPERIVFRDALSQPFEMLVDCVSADAHLALDRLIGEPMTVRLRQPEGGYKPFHGLVFEAERLGSDGGLARYRLAMRPWLSLLGLRRDAFVWQDLSAIEIVEDIFRDYPQAHHRLEIREPLRVRSLCTQYRESDLQFVSRLLAEEGLHTRFEHLDGAASRQADEQGRARHVLVISDRVAPRPSLGRVRFAREQPTAGRVGPRDAITAFAAGRSVQPNAVVVGSWNYKDLFGTGAGSTSALDLGTLPALAIYDGSEAYRFASAAQAERAAGLALQAVEFDAKRFEGQGSSRRFDPGCVFALVDHPLYGADTAASGGTAAGAGRRVRADNAFTLLAVEHHACNNLGARAAGLLASTELEHGSYRNHFHAAPAAAPVVPRAVRKPTAPGAQTAQVVGLESGAPTTDRDHRVKLQFPWQRGRRPVDGGLPHPSSADPEGNAPGDAASGTWVRVALPSAGADFGAVLVPRVGTEVLVGFIEADIDRPIVVGQLWNGEDRPPFAAGVDSGANHPGVLSGLHSTNLDGAGFNQWLLDDSTGQLRMRLATSHARSAFSLGHLIDPGATDAIRGAWRGSGFEARTEGWASVRAGRGLLVSTTPQPGTYGSASSTQMDANAAVARLRAAGDLGCRLGSAAKAHRAAGLASFGPGAMVQAFADAIDPARQGRHAASVGGQDTRIAGPDGRELGTDHTAAFAAPLVVADASGTASMVATSVHGFSGVDTSLAVGGDLQQTAGATWSSVSGGTTSLYAERGGIEAVAAHGPVSLRAHADTLEILADQQVTVVSVNDAIVIAAATRIELVAGRSSVVLDGANISFTTPGSFEAKFSAHAFQAAGGAPADLPELPAGPPTRRR